MKTHLSVRCTVLAWLLIAFLKNSPAAVYNEAAYPGDGVVSGGMLTLTDNGNTINGSFQKGNGNFSAYLVLYIDSQNGSGFQSTSGLSDSSSSARRAVTGMIEGGGSHAITTFAASPTQFKADYAVVLNPDLKGELYQLAAGDLPDAVKMNFSDQDVAGTYRFSFNWADVGIAAQDPHGFKFESLYVTSFGSAYNPAQSFEAATGGGWNGVTFSTYDTYGVEPVPETTNVALAIFGVIAVVTSVASSRIRLRGVAPGPGVKSG